MMNGQSSAGVNVGIVGGLRDRLAQREVHREREELHRDDQPRYAEDGVSQDAVAEQHEFLEETACEQHDEDEGQAEEPGEPERPSVAYDHKPCSEQRTN